MDLQEQKEKELLETAKTIAMVGLSPDTEKASNRVATYLIKHGYNVIPVNPNYDEVLGRKAYRSLSDIPEKIDVVDIFMRADKLLPVVQEAIALKPKAVWLQLDIINEEAKALVEGAGIQFFMNVCMKQEREKIFGKDARDTQRRGRS